jgi:hypothetical protein
MSVLNCISSGRGHAVSAQRSSDAERGIRRRDLLAGAATGVVIGGLGGKTAGAAVAPDDGEWVAGVVESVDGAAALALRPAETEGDALRVVLASGASVVRDGPAALQDFQPGEEASVFGAFTAAGEFTATRVETTYRIFEATIRDRSGDALSTDHGVLQLGPQTRSTTGQALGHAVSARSASGLRPGDRVVASGRLDPATGAMLVTWIGAEGA